MDVEYKPEETKTYTTSEEFLAKWEEKGSGRYRLRIHNGIFELGQWDSGGSQYSRNLYPHPSVKKVLEAIEEYRKRLDTGS